MPACQDANAILHLQVGAHPLAVQFSVQDEGGHPIGATRVDLPPGAWGKARYCLDPGACYRVAVEAGVQSWRLATADDRTLANELSPDGRFCLPDDAPTSAPSPAPSAGVFLVDPVDPMALPAWSAWPWPPVAGAWLLAVIAWAVVRGRTRGSSDPAAGCERWPPRLFLGAAVTGWAAAILYAFHREVGPLVTHDAHRDLQWAVQIARGGAGPWNGPLIGDTAGHLGSLSYHLDAVAIALGGASGLEAWAYAQHALGIGAVATLAAAWLGPRTGVLAGALFMVSHAAVADLSWFIHGNVLWSAVPIALLCHRAATVDGRTGWYAPMMVAVGVAVQHHLMAVVLVAWLLVAARGSTRDAPWRDVAAAAFGALLPFTSGGSVLAVAWAEGTVGSRLTALPLAAAWAIAVLRPSMVRGGFGLLLAAVAVATVGAGLTGLPLRLADFDLVLGSDPIVGTPMGWGPVFVQLGIADSSMGPGWPTLWAAVALGIGWTAYTRDWDRLRPVLWLAALSLGAFVGVGWLAGPELRYASLASVPLAMLAADGIVRTWRAAEEHPLPRAASLAIGGLGAAIGWRVLPLGWVLSVPFLAAAVRPSLLRPASMALTVAAGVGAGELRWSRPPFPGALVHDRIEWDGLRALPGMPPSGVYPCVSGMRDPWLVLSDAAAVHASLEPIAPRGPCGTRWVAVRRTWGENTPDGIDIGQDDLRAIPDPARRLPGTLRVETGQMERDEPHPVVLTTLPYRAPLLAMIPTEVGERIGLSDRTLVPWADRPTARVSFVLDSTGQPPHGLVIRTVDSERPPTDAPPCQVLATPPAGPLTERRRLHAEDLDTVEFVLPPDPLGLPVTVDLHGCRLTHLDVFPIAHIRTSDPHAPPPPVGRITR